MGTSSFLGTSSQRTFTMGPNKSNFHIKKLSNEKDMLDKLEEIEEEGFAEGME